MMSFIIENKAAILGGLLLLSEALALIPALKANSIFQLVVGFLKSFKKDTPAV